MIFRMLLWKMLRIYLMPGALDEEQRYESQFRSRSRTATMGQRVVRTGLESTLRIELTALSRRQQTLNLPHHTIHFFLIRECDHEKFVALMEADNAIRE